MKLSSAIVMLQKYMEDYGDIAFWCSDYPNDSSDGPVDDIDVVPREGSLVAIPRQSW